MSGCSSTGRDRSTSARASTGDEKKKYAADIVAVCTELCDRVGRALDNGRLPVTLGGDHSLAMGSVAGVAAHYRKTQQSVGLLWFDAHGDMNTPESTNSGNVHGMPLSHLLCMGDLLFLHQSIKSFYHNVYS